VSEMMRNAVALVIFTLRAAPLAAALELGAALALAISAPLQALGVKLILDNLTHEVIAGLGVLAACVTISYLSQVVGAASQATLKEKVEGKLRKEVLELAMSIPGIAHYEESKVADQLGLIGEDARQLKYGAGTIAGPLIAFASTGTILGLLAAVHPALLILAMFGGLRVWSAARVGRRVEEARLSTNRFSRRIERLMDIVKSPRNGLEIRAFGLQDVLLKTINQLYVQQNGPRWEAELVGRLFEFCARFVFAIAYGVAIAFVVWLARHRQATVGDVVMLVLLVPQIDRSASSVAESVRSLAEMIQIFGRFRWLRTYADGHRESKQWDEVPSVIKSGISLQHVNFHYPSNSKIALRDVNLFLPAGSTVALIGENGSGKSTLVKLICGLYEPSSGKLLVDDIDLSNIDPQAWYARLSVGFQDFVKFEFLARETVGLGDLRRLYDDRRLWLALRNADAEQIIKRLPDGLDAKLGSQLADGVDLSGGQWQRLAVARAFMRERPLVLLLDEPAAALDPQAEHVLMDRLVTASRRVASETGGIMIIVSHRLSTVREADLIVVLEDGSVSEFGSHDALIAKGGHYAELFDLQARGYR